jgi:hypothetical protein
VRWQRLRAAKRFGDPLPCGRGLDAAQQVGVEPHVDDGLEAIPPLTGAALARPARAMNMTALASALTCFTACGILMVIVHLLCVQRVDDG